MTACVIPDVRAAYGEVANAMVVSVRVCLFSMAESSVWFSHRVTLSLVFENGLLP
jgi:hypothetical protein